MKKFLTYLNLIILIINVIMVNITIWAEKIDYAIFYSIWCLIGFLIITSLTDKE